jgi:hypothetical protein
VIGTRETVIVRLEIEFEILAGELKILEEDLNRMSLSKLVEIWGPEEIGSRVMIRLISLEKKNESRNKKKMD